MNLFASDCWAIDQSNLIPDRSWRGLLRRGGAYEQGGLRLKVAKDAFDRRAKKRWAKKKGRRKSVRNLFRVLVTLLQDEVYQKGF